MKTGPRQPPRLPAHVPDDDACAAWLIEMRWPDGFVCPACGHEKGWALRRKAHTFECPAAAGSLGDGRDDPARQQAPPPSGSGPPNANSSIDTQSNSGLVCRSNAATTAPIVGAIFGDGNIPGRLRLAEISSYGAADLGHFETAADPDAIATDGWSG